MADTPEPGASEENETPADENLPNEEVNQEPENQDDPGKETDQEEPEPTKGYWPEDWKERYIDKQTDKDGKPIGDAAKEKLMKRLARYASPRAAMDAMINAQNKISAGGLVKVPGKDATPEEIAQYRQEIGVPEDANGYDLTLPDGLVIGEEDKPGIDAFLETAHASNYNQQQVTDGLSWYFKAQEDALAARFEADAAHKSEAEEELRAEWGPEYKANVNLMANYLGTDFDEGIAELITGARLADGTPLANHPDILRGFVAKARAANPMGALVPGSGTKQHDQMVDEIASLEKQMGEDGWSENKKGQEKYMKLVSLRDKIPEK